MKDGTGIAKAARPIIERNLEIIASKNEDYGSGNLIQTGVRGVAVRLLDKVNRALTLTADGREGRNDESLADTFTDVANYGLIGRMLQEGLLTEKQNLVYLAGPIDVEHFGDHEVPDPVEWRSRMRIGLMHRGHAVYNPYLAFHGATFTSAAKITSVNRHAIACCDVMVANLREGVTIGTCREIEYAKNMGVRTIAIVADNYAPFGIHDLEVVHSIEEAIAHV